MYHGAQAEPEPAVAAPVPMAMDGPAGGAGAGDDPDYDPEGPLNQEQAWGVIKHYFEQKGLVSQQLESFNEFTSNTMQEIVDETPPIVVRPEAQHRPGEELQDEAQREIRIKFGQIFMSKPLVTEADGETSTLFPKEARLRNLTCASPIALCTQHALLLPACPPHADPAHAPDACATHTNPGGHTPTHTRAHAHARSYCAPMYVNVSLEHMRENEAGEMELDPDMDAPIEEHEKVFLAKVRVCMCVVLSARAGVPEFAQKRAGHALNTHAHAHHHAPRHIAAPCRATRARAGAHHAALGPVQHPGHDRRRAHGRGRVPL
jgi:hypothetical protein